MIKRIGAGLLALLVLTACGSDAAAPKFEPRPTSGLAQYLEKPPNGAIPGGSSWARNYTPSIADFVSQYYAPSNRTAVRTSLDRQGLREIAHALWIDTDKIQGEILLLRFDTAAGAQDRLDEVRKANNSDANQRFEIFEAEGALVYSQRAPNTQGFVGAKAYVLDGGILVEVFTYSPGTFNRDRMKVWVDRQLALLPKG